MNTIFSTTHRKKRTRSAQAPGAIRRFHLTARDVQILTAVYEYRVLTRFHIERLLFPPGASSRCILRLRLLHEHGYLERQEQSSTPSEGRKPYLYLLTEQTARLLADALGGEREQIAWKPSDNTLSQLFLGHLLAGQDVHVAVAVSARRHGFALARWINEAALRSAHAKDVVSVQGPKGGLQKVPVVPDGSFTLRVDDRRAWFFIEIDRGTVTADALDFTRRDWEKKIRAYQAWHASGLFRARYEVPNFRVLTITTGERRLSRLRQVTEEANGRRRYWFSTFDRIRGGDILTDPIWNVASGGDQRVSLIE
jgi:hypothetical protein